MKRELGVWLLLCVAGAGLTLLATGRVWASARYGAATPVEPHCPRRRPAGARAHSDPRSRLH
ncbi:hypothetical protein AB0J22_30550, partial [Nonomuraea dietziae]